MEVAQSILNKNIKAVNGSSKKTVPQFNNSDFEGVQNVESKKLEIDKIQTLIDSCKINLTEVLAPPPVAMQILSEGAPITLFTKGNFSIVTGAAKSRKTFLLSMFMAAAIKGSFYDSFICEGEGVNILFDTEQSRYKAQQIGKRICHLSGTINPPNLHVYSLRTLDPSQRIDLIERVLQSTPKIKLVAIDGIIDLDIDPILQADQAQKIVSKLMKWTELYNIHIVCVLHYNKTVATLLGHLGSFSHRKADAIIEVSKSKEDGNVSLVKALDCREKEFEPFAFSVDTIGMPYILKDYSFEKNVKEPKALKEPKPKAITAHDIDSITHDKILAIAFKIRKEYGYTELWRSFKNAGAELGLSIGDNNAKNFINYYLQNESVILKDKTYTLAGQRDIEFK